MGGGVDDPLGVADGVAAGRDVGGVRDDQVGRISRAVAVEPGDEKASEDDGPAPSSAVFVAVDSVAELAG